MDITKFDKRVISRNLKDGVVSKTEHSSYLKNLEDVAEASEAISIPLYPWDVEEEAPEKGKPENVDEAVGKGSAEETS